MDITHTSLDEVMFLLLYVYLYTTYIFSNLQYYSISILIRNGWVALISVQDCDTEYKVILQYNKEYKVLESWLQFILSYSTTLADY